MKTLLINRISLAALAVSFCLVLYSCQKENNLTNSAAVVSEEQAAVYSDESTQTEASFDDVEDVSMTAAQEEATASGFSGRSEGDSNHFLPLFEELHLRIGHCATITVTPHDSTYPKKITVDFGDGCIGADGKFRKGVIYIYLTGPIRRSGSVMTITFRDFFLNRAHIEGTKIVSNLSENGHIKFTIQVTGGKVTFPNGRGYKYEGIKYVKQIEGSSTRIVRDDIYSIEGRSKTEFNNGVTVTLNTETPLIKKVACHWINEGTLKITINDRVLFLDYGAPHNGDCDNQALLTWHNGSESKLITLP